MHYYQFNIGDYVSHTSHLSPLEDVAYRRMLDLAYMSEKPLPEDISKISRLIRMPEHCDCIANVLDDFFERTEDGYINNRVQAELYAYQDKSMKAKKSAQARWKAEKAKQKQKLTDDANALQPQCEGNAKHKPLTINQEPLNNNQKPDKEPAPQKRGAICLQTFLDEIRDKEKFISPDDPLYDYCQEIGLPEDYLRLTYLEFCAQLITKKKKQKDWRATFRNYVRNNYLDLFRPSNEGGFYLTPKGKQANLIHKVVNTQ